jgi:ATP-dependent helicase HrpB
VGAGGGHDALLQSLLAGHPDRVARRRKPGSEELFLFEGGTAMLARESDVPPDAEWLVALDAEEFARKRERVDSRGGPAPGGALVRLAEPIEPGWILDLFPDEVRETVEAAWNAQAERVDVTVRLMYGSLALDERRAGEAPGGAAAVEEALAKAALAAGPARFADADELAAWLARVAFARTLAPELPALGEADVRAALVELCRGRRSFAELRDAGLLGALAGRLTPEARRALDRLAPEHVVLAGGRRVRVKYHAGRPPSIASRLQDFFGMAEGPRVGGGKVPVVLELLAPNQRPVQVTTDLAGFWERHYPAIRRELGRRYPKHKWPEDPVRVAPPVDARRRRGRGRADP